jgi:hypothetical protein
MASPTVTETGRNPTFCPANPSVDLFANVNVTTDGDDIDELVLTAANRSSGSGLHLRGDYRLKRSSQKLDRA